MTQQTRAQADAKSILAQRVLARRRMIHFAQYMMPEYKAGWVHHDLCARLERFFQAVVDHKSPRLMITFPPRHGKSQLASQFFPAWVYGQDPTTDVILTSYNLDLPLAFSRRVRAMIRDDERYHVLFPETMLSADSQSAETWATTGQGVFTAAGIGGGLTGKGGHLLIIDDPIKNAEEADNQALHEKHMEWFQSTAYTRLAPGGGVLIIQTRWNYADLSGRLQALADTDASADQYEVVDYPAVAEQYEYRDETTFAIVRSPEPLSPVPNLTPLRIPGDVLHPERFTPEMVARIKANLSPRIWSALYQQKPVPDEGLFFRKEYIRTQGVLPYFGEARVYTAWDFAIATKTHNDYTTSSTLIQDTSSTLFIEHAQRFKRDTFGIVEAIIDEAQRVQRMYPAFDHVVGFEDGHIFKTLEPVLVRRMRERRVYFSYEALTPLTDKMIRARPLQSLMQQGMVVFLSTLDVLHELIEELLQFPAGKHDDFVDSLSWAARLALQHEPPQEGRHEPKHKSWKDKLGAIVGGVTSGFMGD